MDRHAISNELVAEYRAQGVVRIPEVISREAAARFRQMALDALADEKRLHRGSSYSERLAIRFNLWLEADAWRELTFSSRVVSIAKRLSGVRLRLWHDHLVAKRPHNTLATEFHQDQTKWPHANSGNSLTAWIALQDTTAESGCMIFIPGSHRHTELPNVKLSDPDGYASIWPEFQQAPRLCLPLRAGDCTFHHNRCVHMAGANQTDEWRIAFAIVYMDADTTYTGRNDVLEVLHPGDVKLGAVIDGERFPEV
jgi:phytanoyl-CoA hydroxylase